MAVKFLSDQWLSDVEGRLNTHEGFQNAAKGQAAKLQQVITGAPDGEVRYGFSVEGGKVALTQGDIEGADATITQDYDTAVKVSKGELNGQSAFMQGKLKISGNLMKMMQLQGMFGAMPQAVGDLDVEY